MVMFHRQFLYPFSDTEMPVSGYRMVDVPVDGDTPVPTLVFDGYDDAPVVIFFMGNVGSLYAHRNFLTLHQMAKVNLVAMTYRGGGGVSGKPSEARLKRDAEAVYQAIPDIVPRAGARIVHGYSLGSGLALHLAGQFDVDAMILSAPYDRICNVMTRVSALPACVLPVDRWDNLTNASRVTADSLILHGGKDLLITPDLSRNLAADLTNASVRRVVVGQADHNSLLSFAEYRSAIGDFLKRY